MCTLRRIAKTDFHTRKIDQQLPELERGLDRGDDVAGVAIDASDRLFESGVVGNQGQIQPLDGPNRLGISDESEFSPVGRRAKGRRDSRWFERFAEMRQGLPDRPRIGERGASAVANTPRALPWFVHPEFSLQRRTCLRRAGQLASRLWIMSSPLKFLGDFGR